MRYDFQRIYEWPTAPKLVVIGLVCLIVFYLGYLLDISNLNTALKKSHQQVEDLKGQIKMLSNNQARMTTELSKFSVLDKTITTQQKQLIKPEELPELINEMIEIGKRNNINFLNFTPGALNTKEAYAKVEIKATISGSYDQLAGFISQIANMNKVVEVDDLTISKSIATRRPNEPASPNNLLIADLNLVVYEAKKP